MRDFLYSCRDKTGKIKNGILKAQDRNSVFIVLRSREEIPISVVDVAGQSGKRTRGTRDNFSKLRKPFMFSVALALCCCFAWILIALLSGKSSFLQKRNFNLKTVQAEKKREGTGVPVYRSKIAGTNDLKTVIKKGNVSPNKSSQTSESEKNIKATPLANTPEIEAHTAQAPELKTASEQLIAMLGVPGEDMPPLPIGDADDLEKDFANASTNIIVIKETDDAETAINKENVAWVKTYIAEAKKMGWTPAQYIRELEKTRQLEAMERNVASQLLKDIEQNFPSDSESAREEINKELLKKGIKPLDQQRVRIK